MATEEEAEAANTSGGSEQSSQNICLITGAGLGVYSVATHVLLGSVCPACIVAAPILVTAGVYKRWKGKDKGASSTHDS